jgi:hypothetical protein
MGFDLGSPILLPTAGGCAPWRTEDQSTSVGTTITALTGLSDRD